MLLAFAQFGFSLDTLLTKAMEVHRLGTNMLSPGKLLADPVTALSMGLGLMFGIAGLPHILMRFFTVTNAQEARKSVFYASGIIAFFFNVIAIMGLSAIVLVGTNPKFFRGWRGRRQADWRRQHGGAAPGQGRWWQPAAGLFVCGGLCDDFGGGGGLWRWPVPRPFRHDLYARVIMKGKASESSEIRVSKIATLGLGVVAVLLGIALKR